MKRCARCKDPKPLSEFSINRSAKDGLQSWCRECSLTYQKQMTRTRRSAPGPQPIYRISKKDLEMGIARGWTNWRMAEEYDCSPSTISRLRGRHGLRFGRHPEKPPEPIIQLEEIPDEALPPLSAMMPVLEMDMLAICRLIRSVRTEKLIEKMGGRAS